jgi:hypothetical protein
MNTTQKGLSTIALAAAMVLAGAGLTHGGLTLWNFDDGNLDRTLGPAAMTANGTPPYETYGNDTIGTSTAAIMNYPGGSGFKVDRGGTGTISQYTVIFDIKIPASGSYWTALLNSDPLGGSASGGAEWGHNWNANKYYTNNWAFVAQPSPIININTGTWQRYALVYDGAAATQKIKIYVNGQLYNTANISTNMALGTTFSLLGETGSYNHGGKVNSILFEDKVYSATLLASMGAPAATGIPTLLTMGADRSNSTTTFGPTLSDAFALNASYATLEAKVTTNSGSSGAPLVRTTAKFLAGTNSSGTDTGASLAWRTRTTSELPTSVSKGLVSDVVKITGMVNSTGSQTDPFVLQMTYDPSLLVIQAGWTEAIVASYGGIYVAWLDTSTNLWENAVAGNTGGSNRFAGLGNFSLQGATLAADLGRWGVNPDTDTVWAVLNHNSQFAVVPDPGTLSLLGLAGAGMWLRRRRRLYSAAKNAGQ